MARLVLERVGTTSLLRLLHEGRAGLLRALLLGSGAGEGDGLCLGGDALVVLALAAAGKGQVGEADGEEGGEDDGDDDAARVDGLLLHAYVLVGAIDGADPAREAVARGALGRRARARHGLAVLRGHVAARRVELAGAEAVGALADGGRRRRRPRGEVRGRDDGLRGPDGLQGGAEAFSQLVAAAVFLAPRRDVLGFEGRLAG